MLGLVWNEVFEIPVVRTISTNVVSSRLYVHPVIRNSVTYVNDAD